MIKLWKYHSPMNLKNLIIYVSTAFSFLMTPLKYLKSKVNGSIIMRFSSFSMMLSEPF